VRRYTYISISLLREQSYYFILPEQTNLLLGVDVVRVCLVNHHFHCWFTMLQVIFRFLQPT
jgi:hypothetical protein